MAKIPADRKRLRWGMVMGGAFLAGLLAAGAALFLPGSGDREQAPSSSSFAPPPSPQSVPQPLPQSPPSRLAVIVDDLGYEPSLDAEWLKLPGKLTVAGPPGWKITFPDSANLAPNDRQQLAIVIDCDKHTSPDPQVVKITGDFPAPGRPVLSLRFLTEPPKAPGQ